MFKMCFMTIQVAHNSKLVKYNIIDQKKLHQNFYSRNLIELSFKKMVGGESMATLFILKSSMYLRKG